MFLRQNTFFDDSDDSSDGSDYMETRLYPPSLLGPYRGILALGRFRTNLAALGPYCHDLITALTLG